MFTWLQNWTPSSFAVIYFKFSNSVLSSFSSRDGMGYRLSPWNSFDICSNRHLFMNLNEIITASSSSMIFIVQWDKLLRLKKKIDLADYQSESDFIHIHCRDYMEKKKINLVYWMAELQGIFEPLCTFRKAPNS